MQEINAMIESLKRATAKKYDDENLSREEKEIEWNKNYVKNYNSTTGNLEHINCDKCNNRGNIMVVNERNNRYNYIIRCECMNERESIERFKKSGLESLRQKYTFSKFKRDNEKSEAIYKLALEFLENIDKKEWFFVGGQVGSGKSHICTAICLNLLKSNKLKFMEWIKDSTVIKGCVLDTVDYIKEISKFLYVDVLYIDDFFKGNISKADIRLAFEILNYRYNNDLITIISSERNIDEILEIDEAIGSRIYQKAYNFTLEIEKDETMNFRLKERD